MGASDTALVLLGHWFVMGRIAEVAPPMSGLDLWSDLRPRRCWWCLPRQLPPRRRRAAQAGARTTLRCKNLEAARRFLGVSVRAPCPPDLPWALMAPLLGRHV